MGAVSLWGKPNEVLAKMGVGSQYFSLFFFLSFFIFSNQTRGTPSVAGDSRYKGRVC